MIISLSDKQLRKKESTTERAETTEKAVRFKCVNITFHLNSNERIQPITNEGLHTIFVYWCITARSVMYHLVLMRYMT